MSKDEIVAALKAEGTVNLKSWGFNGLSKTVFPEAFKKHTQDTYGVPVTLVWDDTNGALQQAEQANKLPSEIGLDVIDSEEDHMPQMQELGWIEKINDPKYDSVLTNWASVDPAYVVQDGLGSHLPGLREPFDGRAQRQVRCQHVQGLDRPRQPGPEGPDRHVPHPGRCSRPATLLCDAHVDDQERQGPGHTSRILRRSRQACNGSRRTSSPTFFSSPIST